MQFNPVKVSTMVPYITSQVDTKIKRKFKTRTDIGESTASIIYINPNTAVRTAVLAIPEASHAGGAVMVFNSTVIPTLDTDESIWKLETGPLKPRFGQLFYRGSKNIEAEIDLSYIGEANADTNNLDVRLHVSGREIFTAFSGGRGYNKNAKVVVTDAGGGSGADFQINITPGNTFISSITVLNGGTGYTNPTLKIVGRGLGAEITASVSNGVITAVSLVATTICKSALPLSFKPAQDKPFGDNKTYNFTLLPGDSLVPKIISTKAGAGTIADCLVYQILLRVKT